ncbi:MAG: cupin domain-containing protein [Microbacterium sp.]
MVDVSTEAPAELGVSVILETIGSRVREMRKAKSLTLADLARATSLSTAIVSQIERGLANPSFSTLVQLAHGLNVPVGKLFPDEEESQSPVVRRDARRDLKGRAPESSSDDTVFELLTPNLSGSLEAIWVVTPPGSTTEATPFKHGGEEFVIVISGKKDVYLNGERYVLEAGDSITYNSSIPHWFANSSDEPCASISVITPPTW